MEDILHNLYEYKTLSKSEAKDILKQMAAGKFNDAQKASFLTVFNLRNITLDELAGFREAMLELCIPVDLSDYSPMDLCGTGGDSKNTFNISTLASFVVAGAGVPVAKHGNYGVSSVSGSSNVLECLGLKFTNDESRLRKQLQEANICFLHAPLFHTAMKRIAPVRKALGVKTFFNILGPLVNPARPKVQLVGVFNMEVARKYQYLYQSISHQYSIIHGLDGYDEISLTAQHKCITSEGEKLLAAKDFGFDSTTQAQLSGGSTVKEAADIFTEVLHAKGPQVRHKVVIANAATAIHTYHNSKSLEECIALATDSLLSKKALHAFEKLIELS